MTIPTHDDMRDDAGLYVLDALAPEDRRAFQRHLESCPQCRAEVDGLAPAVLGLAQAVPQIAPAPVLRERVLAAVAGTTHTAARAASPKVGQGRWGWLAAAAAAVAAVALAGHALRLQTRIDALSARLSEAERTLAATRSDVVEARRALGEADDRVRILLAPDLRRVELAGQPPAAGASARAFHSPSAGLLFTAVNLPPLPAGRAYQLWVVTAQAPVSAGLLAVDASGAASSTIPPSPATAAPQAFAVTIEPAGGLPAPSGDMVLVGKVTAPSI
jgi:anti-sigma-K factor RskA